MTFLNPISLVKSYIDSYMIEIQSATTAEEFDPSSIVKSIITAYAHSYVIDWGFSFVYDVIAPRVFRAVRPVIPTRFVHRVAPAEFHVSTSSLANL